MIIKINIEKLFKIFVILLLFVHTTTLTKGHYGWCSPYDTFCLFSEGNKTNVSKLSEAQLKCSEIKNDSWPVELGDERVKKVFIEFIHNYSISNVILNAYNQSGRLYWKKSNTRQHNFYNNSGFYSNYSVVCMTDCKANWTDINGTQLIQPDAYNHLGIKTAEECKDFCEKNITCPSIDWTYGSQFRGCWIHKYPYNASNLRSKSGISHHVIDRTVKSTDRCIGEAFSFVPESRQNESRNESSKDSQYKLKLIEILVPIILIVSILLIVILIIILYKRKTKRAETSDDFGAYKPAENVGNSQQDGNQTSHEKRNTYDNAEELVKEPNRYPGPRGDQYTDVDVNGKQSPTDGAYKTTKNGGNSQQEEIQTFQTNKQSNKKLITYDNSKEINEEPNRYPGPRGDRYTEVDVDGKHFSADGRVN